MLVRVPRPWATFGSVRPACASVAGAKRGRQARSTMLAGRG